MEPRKLLDVSISGTDLHINDYPDGAFVAELDTSLAQQLSDFELHRNDLASLNSPMQIIGNFTNGNPLGFPETWNEHDIVEGLWTGVAVTYSRCFDDARRYPLNAEAIFSGKPNALDCHKYLWTLRNKHYGHDVNDMRRCAVGAVLNAQGQVLDIVRTILIGQHDMEHFRNVLALIDTARLYAEAESDRIILELRGEIDRLSAPERLNLRQAKVPLPNFERANQKRNRAAAT